MNFDKKNNFKNVSVNYVVIQEFENAELGFKVRCIKNEDGSISMNAEDTAIGFRCTDKSQRNSALQEVSIITGIASY